MADKERIPIDFTPELMDKLTKFSRINATQLMGGVGSNVILRIAEESLAELLLKWCEKPPTATKRSDGFYFISVKHAVINEINKHYNTKKRKMNIETDGNIHLDALYDDMTLEIEDDTTYLEYKDNLHSREREVEQKLRIIVNALEENPYIEEIDFEIFRLRYIEGRTLLSIAEELGFSRGYIYIRHRRIKNIFNYLSKLNGF